jgi:hypothetical protein
MTSKMPLVELERRLSTERVLDIFTMQPKVCIVTYSNTKRSIKRETLTHSFLEN